MYGASARFFKTLTKPHKVVSKVEVLINGQVAYTIIGVPTVDPVTHARTGSVDGLVSVQRAFVRRSCTATFIDVDGKLTPRDASDLFAPLQHEIRLYRGVQYYDATMQEISQGKDIEYVPLITAIIGKASVQYPKITIDGYDRLWDLRGRFAKTYTISAGKNTMDELGNLLRSIIPATRQNISLPTAEFVTPIMTWDSQTDQSQAATDLATACGFTLYADPTGMITASIEPITSVDNVVWTYQPGVDSVMETPEETIDATQAENAVLATNEVDGIAGPIAGYAEDTNPASLTYVGNTPRIVRLFASPLLQTKAQAQLAAKTILTRELGVADTLVVPILTNPAMETTDVIRVIDPRQGMDKLVLVDSFDVSTRATESEQSLTCRTQVI